MAYNYSNPFQPPASSSRSTFGAMSSAQVGSQVLFGGLPLDVSEKDLRDLLINEPLGLAASTTSVKAIYSSTGAFTGTAIVSVGNDVDAERLRREYSGQTIDGTFRLTVQHILSPTQALPSAIVPPVIVPVAQPVQPVVPTARPASRPAPPRAAPKAPANTKPPGLSLLARIGRNGGLAGPAGKDRQLALLAQQRANLKASGQSGAALLSRMTKPKPKPAPVAKVTRAKQSMAMDIDKPVKARPKTQAELDEEMRLYTRQSRFT